LYAAIFEGQSAGCGFQRNTSDFYLGFISFFQDRKDADKTEPVTGWFRCPIELYPRREAKEKEPSEQEIKRLCDKIVIDKINRKQKTTSLSGLLNNTPNFHLSPLPLTF